MNRDAPTEVIKAAVVLRPGGIMNPAPCIAIEVKTPEWASKTRVPFVRLRTRAQISKGLLRVWRPGETEYFLWIPQEINAPQFRRNGARWWQPPAQT